MPQSDHARAAEFHLLAAHAHQSAAAQHGKGDHLSAHELSRQAHEHSALAWQWSQTAASNSPASRQLPQNAELPFGLSVSQADNNAHEAQPAGFNPTMKYKSGASGSSGAPTGAAKAALPKPPAAKSAAPGNSAKARASKPASSRSAAVKKHKSAKKTPSKPKMK
ncbi:MAG: hypothetical protein WA823_21285 [Candidatus Acidiferrales bacterium]